MKRESSIERMSLPHRIVNQCLRINDQDNVCIFFYPHNLTLAEDVAEECFKKGADVNLSLYTDRFYQSYLKELPVESLRQPSVYCQALAKYSTAQVWLGGVSDPSIFQKVPSEKSVADGEGESKAHSPYAKKVRTINVGLALVTKPRAKVYGLNFEYWQKMMNAASNVDYAKLAKTGRKLKEELASVKTIHVTAPNGTNLTFDVKGKEWTVSDGVIDEADVKERNLQDNIPAGSIDTLPEPESADGTIVFNTSLPYSGITVNKIKWRFKDGKLVQFETDQKSAKVKDQLKEAKGDKSKLALFSIGFNPKAETDYTINQQAYGAVTLGIGGNTFFGGTNESGFSFAHTLTGATVKTDKETVLKNGKLQTK